MLCSFGFVLFSHVLASLLHLTPLQVKVKFSQSQMAIGAAGIRGSLYLGLMKSRATNQHQNKILQHSDHVESKSVAFFYIRPFKVCEENPQKSFFFVSFLEIKHELMSCTTASFSQAGTTVNILCQNNSASFPLYSEIKSF